MFILLDMFLTFLKIGVVSFGGGYAMIPLLTEEVLAHGWLTNSEIMNFIAVSESTPGPIAINMATFIGASQYGFLGALVATLGVVLPSFIIILIIATIIKNLLKFAGVKAFLNGVRPVVVALIVGTAITLFLTVVLSFAKVSDEIVFDWKALAIFIIIAGIGLIFKKIKKKKISPILLIIISAILGILAYGII